MKKIYFFSILLNIALTGLNCPFQAQHSIVDQYKQDALHYTNGLTTIAHEITQKKEQLKELNRPQQKPLAQPLEKAHYALYGVTALAGAWGGKILYEKTLEKLFSKKKISASQLFATLTKLQEKLATLESQQQELQRKQAKGTQEEKIFFKERQVHYCAEINTIKERIKNLQSRLSNPHYGRTKRRIKRTMNFILKTGSILTSSCLSTLLYHEFLQNWRQPEITSPTPEELNKKEYLKQKIKHDILHLKNKHKQLKDEQSLHKKQHRIITNTQQQNSKQIRCVLYMTPDFIKNILED